MDALAQRLERLNRIGIALSTERDLPRLLEMILDGARTLTEADGGTLYSVAGDRLEFELLVTESLGVRMGGRTGPVRGFEPIPLYDGDGRPRRDTVVACCVHQGEVIAIDDAYAAAGYDFEGTRRFDARTGYRTRSLLTVPLRNHEGEIIGVLQLINRRGPDGTPVPFGDTDRQLAESLASQAAVALTNRRLIEALENLFRAFIRLIATAIDEKSPHTGAHCRRIPVLTMMLAEAADRAGHGPFAGFHLGPADRVELETAAWLHDCGKITTPEYVIDKATKLEALFDRIELVDTRFEVLKRDAEIEYWKALAAAGDDAAARAAAEARLRATLAELDGERDFLRRVNIGAERMSAADQERVRRIAERRWRNPDGEWLELLTPEEVYNLTVPRGTLTPEERRMIEHHMVATIRMLESLPFPKHLARVPEYAGGHHERMDGRGYPRGLRGDQMSLPARMMAIADVFEALSAADRPYKRGKPLSECLAIMARMVRDGHLDPDLFELFVREGVWRRYAEAHLAPEQIDAVDEAAVLAAARAA
ncbi:MAG: HD family phosphohydrolase [Gammaproteobacteria bacterium]|nr:MAG: HD family phosphohydrolase [Gammaproteobacteria bacterium]